MFYNKMVDKEATTVKSVFPDAWTVHDPLNTYEIPSLREQGACTAISRLW